jgi:hypothetical protein
MTTRGHGERCSRLQERAVANLLDKATGLEAAKATGITDRTLRTWLRDPAFLALYRQARREVVEGAITRLQQTTISAVLTLHRNLSCGNPGVEVRAAGLILDHALQALEVGDVLTRLEALEGQLADRAPAIDVPPQRLGVVPAPAPREPGTNGTGGVP